MRRWHDAAGCVTLALLLVCCSTAPPRHPAPTPVPVPTGTLPDGPASLRYNPARCPCSPWEVRVADHWERVHLVASDSRATLVDEITDKARSDDLGDADMRYAVEASLSSDVRDDRSGHRHRVLTVTTWPIEGTESGTATATTPGTETATEADPEVDADADAESAPRQ